MSRLAITCDDWRPVRRNTLCGFARIHIAELDLSIYDVAVHQKGDRSWARLPSKPWIRDGAVVTDDDGKVQYSPILEFSRREVREAFSNAVVRAVVERFPNALALEETT
jgi:hypothetical protein